ncbi:CynX/NimT family MFS transporter [Variovorax sp. RHLX14]|uniref:CynX/NimT family MFS transporter n=1 Tax=Variovorax sp. RHLX14 TaxID=1259731 RepID=UPI003F4876B3
MTPPYLRTLFMLPLVSRKFLLGVSIVLIAFNLRPIFSSLSVVLPEIVKSTGLSETGASALTTLPVICLGLFAMLAPRLGRLLGLERALLACMVLITVGTALRGLGSVPVLFMASALAGAGIAVSNVLLSGLVKRDFADRSALMMGLYTMAVCGGAATGAGFTVPLEHATGGGWTGALAIWAIPAFLGTLLWAPHALSRSARPAAGPPGRAAGWLWRDRVAWQVTLFMGLQSALAYSTMGWLAPILRERGLSAETAGFVVSISVLAQLATCLLVPAIAFRRRDQVGLTLVLVVSTIATMFGCMFAPLGGIWAWAVLLGLAQGGTFSLALTLIVMRSPDSQVAAYLSGMAQGIGYLIAACGPMLVGLIRAGTGSFDASALLFAALGIALALVGVGAGRARLVGATRSLPAASDRSSNTSASTS